jgi:hypothetical protein
MIVVGWARACLLVVGAWLGLAAPAGATQSPIGKAEVTVEVRSDGAHALFLLDRPASRFAFEGEAVVRSDVFEVVTPGLTFSGDAVAAPAPFRRFEIRIRPTAEERDAKYPAFVAIGAGGVLYAPALLGQSSAWRTSIRFTTLPGQLRAPARGEVSDGMVFVGPASLLTRDGSVDVVADPATPQWLVAEAGDGLASAVRAYTKAMGVAPRRTPLLVLRHFAGGRSFNVGDATPGAVVTLRFHGDAWKTRDPQAAARIRTFIFHEAFHFWNGGIASPAEGTPTWLHEGGADYAALLGTAAPGPAGEDLVARQLAEALNRCRTGLEGAGDKGLSQIGFLTNRIRYPCGMVLQWAVDLSVRRARPGASILDVWAATIGRARASRSKTYGLADFYAAAGIAKPEEFLPAALLVDRSGPTRWSELARALNALGAEVEQEVTPAGRRMALLFHVLGQSCTRLAKGEGFGFYTETDQIRLQTPSGCGVLAGDPPLRTIEGGDPLVLDPQTYAAVQAKCAAAQPVMFETRDGRKLAAPCAKPLADAPRQFAVRRWLPPVQPGSARRQARVSPARKGTSAAPAASIRPGTATGARSSVTVPSLSGRP